MGSPTMRDDDVREVLRRNVRSMLAARELSENMLAMRSGVSQKHINNITNARSGCGVDALGYIARELGVPVWHLLVPPA